MYRLIVLLVLASLLLAGCANAAEEPGYLALLTSVKEPWKSRCSAVVLDEHFVLSARHCSEMSRLVSQSGHIVYVEPLVTWPTLDAAIYYSETPIATPAYAELALPNPFRPARIWAQCHAFLPQVPRYAFYVGRTSATDVWGRFSFADMWFTTNLNGMGADICPGDSGGPLVQDGKVVGLIIGVDMFAEETDYVQEVYSVNPGLIIQAVAGE